ncbi:condensation domain-containing protein [Nocardia sp. NPDC003693]
MKSQTAARLELLKQRLAAAGLTAEVAAPAPSAGPAAPEGALGVAERRMWKIYGFDPESLSHNIGLVLDFEGGYGLDEVIASFETMVERAAVLGSLITVAEDGTPRRVRTAIAGRWAEPGVTWEWGTIPAAAQDDSDIRSAADTFTKSPFDLTREPPLRARITRGADDRVTLALVVHHLAVDDTSWPLLLGTLVSGAWPESDDRPVRSTAPVTQDDVARALEHARNTWAAEGIRFPLDGTLPEISPEQSWLSPMDESAGIRFERPVPGADIAALETVAREVGATQNALLIGVCALGVYALTGEADHVLLIPADNRRQGEGPATVGYTGNIVPMRFRFDPNSTVREALSTAASVVYGSMEFAGVDYGTVLTALRGAGGRFPVAEIMASVRNAPLRGIPVPPDRTVTCESVFHGIGNYPLTLAFELGADDSVHLEIDHQPGPVDDARAQRAADITTALVARIPGALDRPLADLVGAVREPQPV